MLKCTRVTEVIRIMLERNIENYLCNEVNARGCIALKQGFFNGIPDRLILLPNGQHIFVELKKADGRLSAVQKVVIRKLKAMNHIAYVVYSKEDCDKVLRIIDARLRTYNKMLGKE